MRLTLEFASDTGFSLPIHHSHYVQAFIYRSISQKLADMLHTRGFSAQGRTFRLFTFSRILGEYEINKSKETITFASPFRLVVSSPMREFIEELGEELLRGERGRIHSQTLRLAAVEMSDFAVEADKLIIKMLSPATIYSTLSRADGKKKTYYYTPFEREFAELIGENAKKKFRAFYEREPEGGLSLLPVKVNNSNEKIMFYRDTVIKGWMGIYELGGDRELIKLAYDAGLGGKNSQGFGCFEVVGRGD
ncbi:MAG: CRISPR-associated endoribonuclease Cas6 [Deltaproteobacteria bacterium]